MTKKHFIALADHIKHENKIMKGINGATFFDNCAINSLADFCASQNPRFNRERWLDYIAGNCGKNGGKVKAVANV